MKTTMDAKREREVLKKVYRSRKWVLKVNKMTDEQVSDMLKRLKLQGKVEEI